MQGNYLDDGTQSKYHRTSFPKGHLFDHTQGALFDVPVQQILVKLTMACSGWLDQEAPTQELSETDNIRGAKLEMGILGVMVPLVDGAFSPCATNTSAPLSGSPQSVQGMYEMSIAERK